MFKTNITLQAIIISSISILCHGEATFTASTYNLHKRSSSSKNQKINIDIEAVSECMDLAGDLLSLYLSTIFTRNADANMIGDTVTNSQNYQNYTQCIVCRYHVDKKLVGIAIFEISSHSDRTNSRLKKLWRSAFKSDQRASLVAFVSKTEKADQLLREAMKHLQDNKCTYIEVDTKNRLSGDNQTEKDYTNVNALYSRLGFKVSKDGTYFYEAIKQ